MIVLNLIKYFQGYVVVHLTGYAPERFLNLCANHNILIWNLKSAEDGYYFYMSVKAYKKLKPILKKTRTRAKVIQKTGMPFYAFRYRKRKLFFGGILIFAVLLYYVSGFVWNIEVNGNSFLSEETVLTFLEEEQASFGTKKSVIDCAALEEKLRSEYSDIIWASIKIYGTKMTVDLQENLLPEENYEKKEDTVYDIVASKDAIIYHMITRGGNPVVSSGVEVKAGELLVSGRMEIKDDDENIMQYYYQTADADILADVTYMYQDEIQIAYNEKKYTGECKKNYALQIGEQKIQNPFFQPSFQKYDRLEEKKQFHFTDNFYLPVFLCIEDYKAYEIESSNYSFDEAKKLAESHLKEYLLKLEEKGIQIMEKNVMIEKKNQKYVVTGTIDTRESIVSYQPTEILEITSEERQQTNESD